MRTPTLEIHRCFDSRLAALLPDIGLDPETDVAWPNARYEAHVDRLYLKPVCMFGGTEAVDLCSMEEMRGIYQISIFEVLDVGMENATGLAASLIDAFRCGTRLSCDAHTTITILSAYAGTYSIDKDRLHLPVTVVWNCFIIK